MSQSVIMTSQFHVDSVRTADQQTAGDTVIEALRGLAALMVMATHYSYMLAAQPGLWGFGSTGVDLFFVLSGYVFAPYLFGKPLSFLPHLIRRFFRLYPLYLLALLLYVGLRVPTMTAWDHFWVHLVMGHTLVSLTTANFYNPAFWSLPPEVEYYLILPILAWWTARHPHSQSRFVWLVLLAALMHFALVAAAHPDEKGITVRAIATIHLPGLLIEFMLGSAAYAIVQQGPRGLAAVVRLAVGLLVLVGMAFIFAIYVMPVDGVAQTAPIWIGGNFGLGAALGYALVVSGVASPLKDANHQPKHSSATKSRLQAVTVLQTLCSVMGALSYGIYLFHNAAPQILRRVAPEMAGGAALLACLGVTTALAFAAHHAIEKPMRAYGRKLSHAAARSK